MWVKREKKRKQREEGREVKKRKKQLSLPSLYNYKIYKIYKYICGGNSKGISQDAYLPVFLPCEIPAPWQWMGPTTCS